MGDWPCPRPIPRYVIARSTSCLKACEQVGLNDNRNNIVYLG